MKKPAVTLIAQPGPSIVKKNQTSKLQLPPQPPKLDKVKKMAQLSGRNRMLMNRQGASQQQHDFMDDPFEKELIQEEAALNDDDWPQDDTQLMIRSLEQNTKHLQ